MYLPTTDDLVGMKEVVSRYVAQLRECGYVVTVTQAPLQPLAMGNYRAEVDVRAARSPAPTGEACDCCKGIRAAEAIYGDGPETATPPREPLAAACFSPLATRPVLYTDTVGGVQTRRDDLWAVTTDELNTLHHAAVTLTGNQLRAALGVINPDGPGDEDQCNDELTFGVRQHRDDGGKVGTGMCCWNDDMGGEVFPLPDEYDAPAPPTTTASASTIATWQGRCGITRKPEGQVEKAMAAEIADRDAELASLRAEVREWACADCNTTYPGPPGEGMACAICPKCKGTTAPRGTVERLRLEAEIAALRAPQAPYLVLNAKFRQALAPYHYDNDDDAVAKIAALVQMDLAAREPGRAAYEAWARTQEAPQMAWPDLPDVAKRMWAVQGHE